MDDNSITVSQHIESLPHTTVGCIGEEDYISWAPLQRLGQTVECIRGILHYEKVVHFAVHFLSDEGSGLIDELL